LEKSLSITTIINILKKIGWILETPYDVRDDANAMRDLLKNYKSNFSTLDSEKKKKKTTCKMQFKSKKRDESETIVIHNKNWRKKGGIIHSTFFWEGTTARKGATNGDTHSVTMIVEFKERN